ncbi:MAG: DUF4838 domain-containing protein [Victivallales bacterium]
MKKNQRGSFPSFKSVAMLLLLLLGACFPAINCNALEITPEFLLVKGKFSGLPSESSATVLSEHLEKMFGKKLRIISESEYNGKDPAIILAESSELDDEEWNIRTAGGNLLISGGHPRGLYYGVCEFLEKFGGIRWFSARNTLIPRTKSFTIPDGREFRRKPAFPMLRNVGDSIYSRINSKFHSYNKSSSVTPYGKWPTLFTSRGLDNSHTFWKLTVNAPEHLLPIDASGNRVRAKNGLGPGQLCYANKEFRAYAKKEIARQITEWKAFLKKHNIEEQFFLRWIDVSQNDNAQHCMCDGCKALIKKYGTLAGAQLEFINDIASAFPEYMFQTFAYHRTILPPKGIKARDNVLIHFAFLGDGGTYYDVIRPLSHPVNAPLVKWFNEWNGLAKHKAVWSYHRLYQMTEAFPWPQCCYWYIAEDARFYHKLGVKKIYDESEYSCAGKISPRAFHDLHIYLALKLYDDPAVDEKKLINEFFSFMYGAAAPEMHAYSALLKQMLESMPGKICGRPLTARTELNAEFFRQAYALIDRAEAKVKNDPARLECVRMEQLPLDFAAANLWEQVDSKLFSSRAVVCDRLERNIRMVHQRQYSQPKQRHGKILCSKILENDLAYLQMLRNPIPVPAGMEKEDIIQVSVLSCDIRSLISDPEATYGKAIKLGKVANAQFDHDRQPMEFGIYNETTKQYELKRIIEAKDLPKNEKYHLYLIGRNMPKGFEKQRLWGHRSWGLRIHQLYRTLWSPIDPSREYDIYISCKLTGPAYVKGSKSENAVYVDKLVAVKRGIRLETE